MLPSSELVTYSEKLSRPGQEACVYLESFVVHKLASSYSSRLRIGSLPYVLKNWSARISLLRAPELVDFAAELVA